MDSHEIAVETGSRMVTDLTDALERFCNARGSGLVNVFVPHATASLAIMETGSGSESDLARAIDAFLPIDNEYTHRHGTPGHGRDHVLPCFLNPSITLPCLEGRPMLGTWQSLVLVDSNRDNPRRFIRFSFLT